MTTPATPRTAAGRAMLAGASRQDRFYCRAAILAIENEMYDLASNEGYHVGIADCKEHDPAHHPAAPDALQEALERLCEAAEDKDTHQHLDGPNCVPAVSVDAIRKTMFTKKEKTNV